MQSDEMELLLLSGVEFKSNVNCNDSSRVVRIDIFDYRDLRPSHYVLFHRRDRYDAFSYSRPILNSHCRDGQN